MLHMSIGSEARSLEAWRRASRMERAGVAKTAAAIMRARGDEFARAALPEAGKDLDGARCEVALSAEIIWAHAESVESGGSAPGPATGASDPPTEGQPVLFCVQSPNCSYDQLARFVVPGLVAGNVVLIKHPKVIPQSAVVFESLWREAGAPAGIYVNLLMADD
jgi:succinate-semialdehyde dehydrogenase / glutarate-semialdehyde dehydrogenase